MINDILNKEKVKDFKIFMSVFYVLYVINDIEFM